MKVRHLFLFSLGILFSIEAFGQVPELSVDPNPVSLRGVNITSNVPIEALDGGNIEDISPYILAFKEVDDNGPDVTFNYSSTINGTDDIITIMPENLFEPNQTYYIRLDSVRRKIGDEDTLGITTYTFTTGSGVTVNNVLTSNICIGETDGTVVEDIVITENLADNFYNEGDGLEHSLRLDLPQGFEFTNSGSATFESPSDAVGAATTTLVNNDRSLIINYYLCSGGGGNCTANTAHNDELTISGVEVVATSSMLDVNTTYEITRAGGGPNNDAVMPGIPNGTVFATLNVAAGPEIAIFDGNTNAITEGETVRFCPEGDVSIRFANPDNTPLNDATDDLTIYVEGQELAAGDFNLDYDSITFNAEDISAFLIDNSLSDELPIEVRAEISRDGEDCTGYSVTIEVDEYTVVSETPVITASNGIVSGGKVVPSEGLETNIEVDLTGGKLDVLINNELYTTRSAYNNNLTLDLFELASESAENTVEIKYTAYTNNGCRIGSSNAFIFTILKLPRIEAELSILPSYCVYEDATIDISFSPDNIADEPIIANFTLTGYGITGNTSSIYDPVNGEDSTGYTFSVSAARAAALADDTTAITLELSYDNTERTIIYGQVCKDSTYTISREVCDDVYGCRPCRIGDDCYNDPIDPCDPFDPNSLCYDECLVKSSTEKHSLSEYEERAVQAPICLDPLKLERLIELRDSLNAVRIAHSLQSTANAVSNSNNCLNCGPNEQCVVIGENCRIVQEEITVQVCSRDSIGVDDVTSRIEKLYTVQFIDIPDLVFRTVTRDSVKTVYCEDSDPVFLLGGPGDTFESKSFLIYDGITAPRPLADYSFTPGDSGLLAREEPYELIYQFLGNASNCPTSDTLSFRVVPVPEEVVFPAELPTVNDIATYKYCLNSVVDTVRLPEVQDIEYVWRDERGFPLDTGNSFLPVIETNEVGLTRFTVEKRHVLGGCSSNAVTDFYIQIGESPEADFSFSNTCNNTISFFSEASHSGVVNQGDSISSVFYRYNDAGASDFIEVNEESHQFTFPGPGVYEVDMLVQTAIGCTDTITKKVTVFDAATYNEASNTFEEDFADGQNGWISTAENDNALGAARNSSWQLDEVDGRQAWHTLNDNTGTYSDNEFSWVAGPCIDMSRWQSPKLTMDVRYDTPDLEGAVLQYRLEGTQEWVNLGEPNAGVGWFNSTSISAGPGGSITGWSGTSGTADAPWETVAFELSTLKAAANGGLVQLRVAFASLILNENRDTSRFGFAFSNITIAEKSRINLLEYFTNLTVGTSAESQLRNAVADFANSREDVIYIQYHTPYPEPDELYYSYEFGPSTGNHNAARTLHYGFDVGSTVLNGRVIERETAFTNGWGQRQYSEESLYSPSFDVGVDYTYTQGGNMEISAYAVRNSSPNALLDSAEIDRLATLRVAVVENEVIGHSEDTLYNVLVRYLPDHAGIERIDDWGSDANADSLLLNHSWTIPVDANPNRFSLVAWVQMPRGVGFNKYGEAYKEVFQVAKTTITDTLQANAVLANRKHIGANWKVYPIPTTEQLTVQTDKVLTKDVSWQVIDLQGKLLSNGYSTSGGTTFEIPLQGIKAGVYLLRLHTDDGTFHKKFVKE